MQKRKAKKRNRVHKNASAKGQTAIKYARKTIGHRKKIYIYSLSSVPKDNMYIFSEDSTSEIEREVDQIRNLLPGGIKITSTDAPACFS